jgi:hypothetical protein
LCSQSRRAAYAIVGHPVFLVLAKKVKRFFCMVFLVFRFEKIAIKSVAQKGQCFFVFAGDGG